MIKLRKEKRVDKYNPIDRPHGNLRHESLEMCLRPYHMVDRDLAIEPKGGFPTLFFRLSAR